MLPEKSIKVNLFKKIYLWKLKNNGIRMSKMWEKR